MDDAVGWLVVVYLVLVVLAYLFVGIGWLFAHELPLMILLLLAGALALALYWRYRYNQIEETVSGLNSLVEKTKKAETRASRVVATIVAERPAVERSDRELEQMRQTMCGEVNFHALTHVHNTSRLTADAWYNHMQEAIDSHRVFSEEIDNFHRHVRSLEIPQRSRKHGRQANAIKSSKSAVSHLRKASSYLQQEIDRSRVALKVHNDQTKMFKEHIRDNCGERGRRWYAELEERTRMRKLTR